MPRTEFNTKKFKQIENVYEHNSLNTLSNFHKSLNSSTNYKGNSSKLLYEMQDKLVNKNISYSLDGFLENMLAYRQTQKRHETIVEKRNFGKEGIDFDALNMNNIDFDSFENTHMYELKYGNNVSMDVNMEKDNNRTSLICSACNKVFSSQKGLQYHVKNTHEETPKLENISCVKLSTEKKVEPKKVEAKKVEAKKVQEQKPPKIVTKEKVKKVKEYKCDACNKQYKNHNGLKYHNTKYHNYKKQVKEKIFKK